MRFQAVEIIIVFPVSRPPPEPDLRHFRWDDGKMSLKIPIQKIRHHDSIGHDMNHQMTNTGEKFGLLENN